jgi:hypothetical protein
MDIFLDRKSWEICGRILLYGLKSKFKIPKDGSADIHTSGILHIKVHIFIPRDLVMPSCIHSVQ